VSRFVDNAMNLLQAAENARQAGPTPTDLTVLINSQGQIRMVVDSDWPLDSLQAHHGAATAYRVTHQPDKILIDGREGTRTCRFESEDPRRAARLILGNTRITTYLSA
jgi:hypothetical protein